MPHSSELLLRDCIGLPAAALAMCQEPWQIFRRDRTNYTVRLPAGGALVTVCNDVIVRIDGSRPPDRHEE